MTDKENSAIVDAASTTTTEDKWSLALYLAAIIPIFPLSNVALPLGIWLFKKDEFAGLNWHGKNILNFQIAMIVLGVIFLCLFALMFLVPFLGFVIVFLLSGLWTALYIIPLVIGGVKAYQGAQFKLPLQIKFIK